MCSRKIITVICIGILFCGCGNQTADNDSSVEVITLNPNQAKDYINLSEIVDSVKCIRLQVDSGDVMGSILKIVIKKKYIYAADVSQQIIFVFDKNGKFVSKLDKKGPGPDDYSSLGPFFIDDNEEFIEMLNDKVKLKYANISFKLIESLPFSYDSYYGFCERSAGIYYCAAQQWDNIINGKKTNAGLVIINDTNNVKTLFDKNIVTNNNYFSLNCESFARNDKNELFMSLMYDNTFYRLDAGEAYPVFTIDFGKYSINNNAIGLKSTEEQMSYLRGMNNLASFPVLNLNNSEIMSFSYYFKQSKRNKDEWMYRFEDYRQYIKMKKSNKVYHVKKIKNDITDFPNYIYISSYFFGCAHEVWHDDYLIDVVVPNYYFSDDDPEKIFVDGLGEITADDDPIVVMMKLKKDIL
jgi:hypothetical protein